MHAVAVLSTSPRRWVQKARTKMIPRGAHWKLMPSTGAGSAGFVRGERTLVRGLFSTSSANSTHLQLPSLAPRKTCLYPRERKRQPGIKLRQQGNLTGRIESGWQAALGPSRVVALRQQAARKG